MKKSILTEIKNSLKGFNIRFEQMEEIFSDLENISIKTIKSKKQKEKKTLEK